MNNLQPTLTFTPSTLELISWQEIPNHNSPNNSLLSRKARRARRKRVMPLKVIRKPKKVLLKSLRMTQRVATRKLLL